MVRDSLIARASVFVVLALLCAACDVDLFGNDRQPLTGPYGIFVGDGKFYLVLDRFEPGCGLLDGAIRQIGWNETLLLVQIQPCVGDGPSSDWRLVDVKTQKIEAIDERTIKTRADLVGIRLISADDAWSSGRSRRK